MRQVSCGKFRLGDEVLEGGVERCCGLGERAVGRGTAAMEELREAGAQDASIELGEAQCDAFAEVGDFIALGAGDAGDEAMQSQAAQIVGHAGRRRTTTLAGTLTRNPTKTT